MNKNISLNNEYLKLKKVTRQLYSGDVSNSITYAENLREKRRGILYESYGIHDYSNELYNQTIINFVSNNVRNTLNNRIRYDSIIPSLSPNRIFKKLSLNLNSKWLGRIDLYITDHNIPNEYMGVLCSVTGSNGVVNNHDVIDSSGKSHVPYEFSGNFVNYVSIYACVGNAKLSTKAEIIDFSNCIKHEISHAYDLLRDEYSGNHMNRDIIYFDNKLSNSGYSFQTRFYSYPNNILINFIKSLNIDAIFYSICDIMYFLNLSELKARLNNFKSEVEIDNSFPINRYDTYKSYNDIKGYLNKLKEYVSNNDKIAFCKKYLKDFETVHTTDDVSEYKFKKNAIKKTYNFKVSKTVDERTFDNIMDFYIDRIDRYFFKQADKIYCDLLSDK